MKKADILKVQKENIETPHRTSTTLDELELFRTFKKYDRNMNGFLDFSEYT